MLNKMESAAVKQPLKPYPYKMKTWSSNKSNYRWVNYTLNKDLHDTGNRMAQANLVVAHWFQLAALWTSVINGVNHMRGNL